MEVLQKPCFKCLIVKPLSDYYKHPKTTDGYLGKCKECTKKDTKDNFERKSLEDVSFIKSERKRHREKYHRLGYKDKHKPDYESKKNIMDKYNKNYPEKAKCRSI